MEDYFAHANRLKLVLVLLDSRRELNQDDLEIVEYLKSKGNNYLLTFTKVDKINQSEKHKLLVSLESIGVKKEEVVFTSTLKTHTFDVLKKEIEKYIK